MAMKHIDSMFARYLRDLASEQGMESGLAHERLHRNSETLYFRGPISCSIETTDERVHAILHPSNHFDDKSLGAARIESMHDVKHPKHERCAHALRPPHERRAPRKNG